MAHALSITEWLQTAGDHNPIIATQYAIQFGAISFGKQFSHGSTPFVSGSLSYLTTFRAEFQMPNPFHRATIIIRESRRWDAPRAAPVSLASGKPHLVRLSLFGFGSSELGLQIIL
jgi:hypothetical protein